MKLLEFALLEIWRRRYKNGAIFVIFAGLVALTAAIFLAAASIKSLLYATLDDQPDIYLQRVVAGRLAPFGAARLGRLYDVAGIEAVYERVWGYYYFQPAGVNFTVVGVDPDFPAFSRAVTKVLAAKGLADGEMLVGKGVRDLLERHWYKERFNFIRPDGEMIEGKIAGTITSDTLIDYDTIVVTTAFARKIFGLAPGELTDVAIDLANPAETRTIAQKLRYLYPDMRVITKEDLRTSYQNIFDYKSGIFLALLIAAFAAFFILVFERSTALSREQSRQIAILKALGWRVEDILKVKFLEGAIVSLLSYWVGILVAYYWVYGLQGVGIREVFSGFSVLKPPFVLEPVFDSALLVSIFLATVPLYIAATIVPNWLAAVSDTEEALR